MSKLVVLTLLGRDLNQEFIVVTAEISHQDKFFKITGSLPEAPELNQSYQKWKLFHKAVHQRLGNNQRIRVHTEDITNVSIHNFDEVCQQLRDNLNQWLKFESFQNIERQLRTLLARDDEIRIIIETNIAILHSLPWHLWDFFDDYPKAELGLSNDEYASPQVFRKNSTGKVKILAVLGNGDGLNLDKDASFLENLTDTQTTFLVEPSRKELDEQLWNRDWDILFFAGHSATLADGEIGEIYINETESLTISQFKNALKTAISRGLNVVIFNSCDGIGLARNLADLNIPQMIVMRTGIPDFIAGEFLKNFLIDFAASKPLYLAFREARERLQGLENEFPCASWLPIIYQNPTTIPITWKELQNRFNVREYLYKSSIQSKNYLPGPKFLTILISTFIIALSTISLRYLGFFEKIELQTFDQMLQLKNEEEKDSRIVVVKITEKDIQSLNEKTIGPQSISDSTLAKLLNKLQKYKPRIIGLNMYRDLVELINKSNPIQLSTELSKNNVIVACKGQDKIYDPQGVKPPQGVTIKHQGFTDAIKDPDGIIRRHILMMRQELTSPCKTTNSLALQLASYYLSYEDIKTKVNNDAIKFGSKEFKRLKPGLSGGYQTVDIGGIQIIVNYRNTDFHLQVSLRDILEDKIDSQELKDKILLIGVTANTIRDNWSTPQSSRQQAFQETSGVIIQAQKISQILSAVLDNRPIIWVLPSWGDFILIWAWSLFTGITVSYLILPSHKGFAIAAIVISSYGFSAIAIISQGLWMPFIPSVFAIVTSGVVILLIHNRGVFTPIT